jgi:Flp pilus assembly protein TadG
MRSPSPGDRARRAVAGDRGGITAEFAVAVPAVLLVLGLCLGMLQLAAQQVRYTDAAAVGARSLARGEEEALASSRALIVAGPSSFSSTVDGEFVCATVSGRGAVILTTALGIELSASSCALAGGL